MKTAIIGLPMVGKTSLFTILTGVHQETRIGSTAARTGVAKVPDARLDALAQAVRAAQGHARHGGIRGHARDLEGEPARPQLPRQPARGRRLRARAAPVRRRDRPPRKGLGRSRCATGRRGDRADPQRPGGGRKAPGAPRQGPQEDQEPGTRPRVRAARQVQSTARGQPAAAPAGTRRAKTRSASAASSSSRRSPCSTC